MKKIIILILMSVITHVAIAREAFNPYEGWKRVAQNNYVNLETVVGLEDRYGYSFLLKSFNKGQYEPVNGRQILYTLNQYEIDCGKRTYKIGTIDSYDDEENFVNGDYNRYAQFQPIVIGTAVDVISRELCRSF